MISFLKPMFLLAAATAGITLSTACVAQEYGEAYRARLLLSGYLLRSALVCGGSSAKQTVEKAMRYAYGGDLKQFSQAYPQTAEGWMKEGSGHFNEGVMKNGLKSACAEAQKTAHEAP